MSKPITVSGAQALNPNFTVTFSNIRGIKTHSNLANQINGVHPGAFNIRLSIE